PSTVPALAPAARRAAPWRATTSRPSSRAPRTSPSSAGSPSGRGHSGSASGRGDPVGRPAAGHEETDLVDVCAFDRHLADDESLVDDREPVGDLEQLVEVLAE